MICTVLYISVAAVLTGMVPWREINIEAPIARAFLDRGLTTASHIITLGALAGLTSVMLVMLLGQTRVLYSMANDGLLPKKFFADVHPKFRTPWKNTILVGLARGHRRKHNADRRHRQDGEHRDPAGICDRLDRGAGAAQDKPRSATALSGHRGCRWCRFWAVIFNGYMMYKLGWINWARLIVWLFIGLVVYFAYGRFHSRVQQDLARPKPAPSMAD